MAQYRLSGTSDALPFHGGFVGAYGVLRLRFHRRHRGVHSDISKTTRTTGLQTSSSMSDIAIYRQFPIRPTNPAQVPARSSALRRPEIVRGVVLSDPVLGS